MERPHRGRPRHSLDHHNALLGRTPQLPSCSEAGWSAASTAAVVDSLGLNTDLSIPRLIPHGNFTSPPLLHVGNISCATRHALHFPSLPFCRSDDTRSKKSKFPRSEEIAPSLAYISMRCGGCDVLGIFTLIHVV